MGGLATAVRRGHLPQLHLDCRAVLPDFLLLLDI